MKENTHNPRLRARLVPLVVAALTLCCRTSTTQPAKHVDGPEAQRVRTIELFEHVLNNTLLPAQNPGKAVSASIPVYQRGLGALKTKPLDAFLDPMPLAATLVPRDEQSKIVLLSFLWIEREFRVRGFYLVAGDGERLMYPNTIMWSEDYMTYDERRWDHLKTVYVYTDTRQDLVDAYGPEMRTDDPTEPVIHLPLDLLLQIKEVGLIDVAGNLLPVEVFTTYDYEPDE